MRAKDWREYRAVSITVAVSVGVLGGSGVAFALNAATDHGPSPEVLAAAVNTAHKSATLVLTDVAEVERVGDFPALSSQARSAAKDVEGRLRLARTSDDVEARQAANSALVPILGLMNDVARLETVTPDTLAAWDDIEEDLESHAVALAAAETAVLPAVQHPESTAEAGQDAREAVGPVVKRADRKIMAWRRSVKQFRKDRTRNRSAATTYEQGVRSNLAQYAGTRSDLQRWINGVESYGATFAEAYSELAQQKEARQQVRSQLAALTPPVALAGSHNRVLAVIDQAIDALDSASEGLNQLQHSRASFYGPYDSYDETPSWREFRSASDRISAEFPAAQAAWERDAAAYIKQLKSGTPPERPSV